MTGLNRVNYQSGPEGVRIEEAEGGEPVTHSRVYDGLRRHAQVASLPAVLSAKM